MEVRIEFIEDLSGPGLVQWAVATCNQGADLGTSKYSITKECLEHPGLTERWARSGGLAWNERDWLALGGKGEGWGFYSNPGINRKLIVSGPFLARTCITQHSTMFIVNSTVRPTLYRHKYYQIKIITAIFFQVCPQVYILCFNRPPSRNSVCVCVFVCMYVHRTQLYPNPLLKNFGALVTFLVSLPDRFQTQKGCFLRLATWQFY